MKNEEKLIIEELKRGSMSAFSELYETYSGLLYSFAKSLLKSEIEAEDIVQDTFIKVWVKRMDISPEYSFKSYLFTIAKHQIISDFRRKVIQMDIEACTDPSLLMFDKTPETEVMNQELAQLIDNSVKNLNPLQSKVFIMSKLDGMSLEEISRELDIPLQTVKNNLTIAMKILRSQLQNLPGLCLLLSNMFYNT